jgi:hypothetical protein
MRALGLILMALSLAACGAGTRLTGDQARTAMTAPAASDAAPGPRSVPAPADADPPAAGPAAAEAPASGPRDLTEAKVICWGKVEREKQRVRTIDQRITYVERCVAEQMKARSN